MHPRWVGRLGLALGLSALAASGLAWTIHRDQLPAAPTTVAIGARLPGLQLTATSGEVRLIDQMGGRPAIVVVFLGSWCPYCRNELSRFRAALEQQHSDGITILGTSADPPEILAELKRRLDLPFELLTDPAGAVAATCNLAMHCVLLLDSNATLRWAGYAESWHDPIDYARVVRAAQRML